MPYKFAHVLHNLALGGKNGSRVNVLTSCNYHCSGHIIGRHAHGKAGRMCWMQNLMLTGYLGWLST